MTLRWFMLGSIAALCAGCAAGEGPEADGVPGESAPVASDAVAAADDSVGSVQQTLDTPCVSGCLSGCVCTPEDGKPAACRRLCRAECIAECACAASCASKACGAADGCGGVCSTGTCPAGQTCGGGGVLNQCGCTASCAGKACGAADGCGGVCSAGACPSGTTCGGAGVPNQCGCTPSCLGKGCGAADGCGGSCSAGLCPGGAVCGGAGVPNLCALPDLNPFVSGTLQIVGFNSRRGIFDVTIRNLGPADATNVELLIQTNSPAGLLNLTTTGGFACSLPNGYFPRLGLACVGGTVPHFGTATLQITTSLSVSGPNVLSVIADPNNAIVELWENNNSSNATVFVP